MKSVLCGGGVWSVEGAERMTDMMGQVWMGGICPVRHLTGPDCCHPGWAMTRVIPIRVTSQARLSYQGCNLSFPLRTLVDLWYKLPGKYNYDKDWGSPCNPWRCTELVSHCILKLYHGIVFFGSHLSLQNIRLFFISFSRLSRLPLTWQSEWHFW